MAQCGISLISARKAQLSLQLIVGVLESSVRARPCSTQHLLLLHEGLPAALPARDEFGFADYVVRHFSGGICKHPAGGKGWTWPRQLLGFMWQPVVSPPGLCCPSDPGFQLAEVPLPTPVLPPAPLCAPLLSPARAHPLRGNRSEGTGPDRTRLDQPHLTAPLSPTAVPGQTLDLG